MIKIPIALICLACGLGAAAPLHAEEGFSSLEEQMTGKEFTAAGLDKLSAAELEVLNKWIRKHSLATLAAPAAASAAATDDEEGRGSEDEEEVRSPITSRLVGKFSGWDGQTVFKLENGMIWAQADKDKFWVEEVENPVAIIERGMFGSWRLQVEGFDSDCKVKRIQ